MYNKIVRPPSKRKLFSLSNVLILTGILFLLLSFGPLVFSEIWYFIKQIRNQEYSLSAKNTKKESVFGKLLSTSPIRIVPVNKDFSIVIEKIDVNAPIVPNVSVTDENSYKQALRNGVASAISSDFPTTAPSNVYLFAHASLNFWELGKYATTFNLLRKLNYKDRIHVFYKQRDFVYEVANKEVVKGWDMTPLTRAVIEPLLTLQTCDPPGTTLNRFIVTAKLVEVKEAVD
jgi:LPXTG-site transpeptidase (sortase) family protein